jgi:Tfp pilus assembly protein PilF
MLPETPGDARVRQQRSRTRQRLASLYQQLRRFSEAEVQCRALLREEPHDAAAWQRLGELWLGQGRWADVEQAAGQLSNGAGAAPEGVLLRARVHLARREFVLAKELLAEAIARDPLAEGPRMVLSYVYLQEGTDPAATEQALRDVLVVNPHNAEARHNLTVFLREQERTAVGATSV